MSNVLCTYPCAVRMSPVATCCLKKDLPHTCLTPLPAPRFTLQAAEQLSSDLAQHGQSLQWHVGDSAEVIARTLRAAVNGEPGIEEAHLHYYQDVLPESAELEARVRQVFSSTAVELGAVLQQPDTRSCLPCAETS